MFSWTNISHILTDSQTDMEEEQVVTKNLSSDTWKSEWATAQRFTGHEQRWGLALSELCRMRAAFSSLGPALRHPEAPGCSLHSTLGQGSTWHDSKQSREPEALPGQTATWHLLPGTKEMSNSIQQPSGRALTSALCVGKISGGERDLMLCSRNAHFSGLHTSYRCLKYCTKTRGKKTIRTWDKNLLICTFWTPSAANSMVLCYTQHEVRCSHCVWTRQSAATVILNISLNNFKQVQTSSVRNFTCGPSHLVSQLSSGNSYATSFCMPQSCQTPWHWEQDTDCPAVAYSCLQHFTQEPECSASSNHDTSWCTIPTFQTNLKNQNSA